jgi:hypothetical protein
MRRIRIQIIPLTSGSGSGRPKTYESGGSGSRSGTLLKSKSLFADEKGDRYSCKGEPLRPPLSPDWIKLFI